MFLKLDFIRVMIVLWIFDFCFYFLDGREMFVRIVVDLLWVGMRGYYDFVGCYLWDFLCVI